MRKHFWLKLCGIAAVAAVAVAFAAHAVAGPAANGGHTAGQHTRSPGQGGTARPAGTATPSPAASPSPENQLAARLSPRQLAGQRVIYSYSGLTPPQSLLRLIRRGQAAGVIFFAANFQSRPQFETAVHELEAANASASNPARRYPLLLMTDQEGGEVKRLPGAPQPSEKWIGERGTAAARARQATAAGRGAGRNLRGFGINVNLAPVLGVYRAPGDFLDQYQRSYSMRAGIVSALGADFIAAQQAQGVAATAKHFPGLGAATASEDTDDVPVTIHLSKAALQNTDEYPYRAAIAAGVKLVMVSWARYPSLGSGLPAGLSSTIVSGQLRSRLGFRGVTITDAIGAGALVRFGGARNRALRAAEAGMDLILASGGSPAQGVQCTDGLLRGYQAGSLGRSAFQAIVAQILQLRAGLPA